MIRGDAMLGNLRKYRIPRQYGEGNGYARNGVYLNRAQTEALSEVQQIWQRLALNLLASDALKVPWALGIASAVRGEGRTTTAVGLATALARETESPVALLEVDLGHPALASEIAAGDTPGIMNHLRGECEFDETFRATNLSNLTLVPATSGWLESPLSPPMHELAVRLRHRMPTMLRQLKDRFSLVIVDLPPVLSDMHSEAMLGHLDGSLMVVRAGVSQLPRVQDAIQLAGEGRILGALHVGQPSAIPSWLSGLIQG